MLIRNSLRQLCRRKKQALLFVLLLITASGLCGLGRGYLSINKQKMGRYEDSFMTIGTVKQKEDALEENMNWDAEKKEWSISQKRVYERYLPLEILDFEGANYLSGPEKRVCYGAYLPEYVILEGMVLPIMVEVSPVEDAVPDHPIELVIKSRLYAPYLHDGDKIRFCDHYNPNPQMMYKDKTYVMCIQDTFGHESEKEYPEDDVREYIPAGVLESTQTDENGVKLISNLPEGYFCEEVTDGFYDTELGKRWLNCLESWEYCKHIFPVTATDNIHLLMAFYKGDVSVSEGREFTEEEYRDGTKVCMVSAAFAANNDLQVGDSIPLPLIFANHRFSAGALYRSFGMLLPRLINAKGEIYPIFEESSYEIVGIYQGITGTGDKYGMGYQEILIPSKSVRNSDADNIIYYGPMDDCNTSFEIENGTIADFMEKWEKTEESRNVEITFYDYGYTKLADHIKNMRWMAGIFLVLGTVMMLVTLSYFVWLFVVKEKERTIVERAIGFSRRQSFISLFSGIFVILLLGSMAGSLGGAVLSKKMAANTENVSYYDTTFGNGAAVEIEDIRIEDTKISTPLASAAGTEAAILLVGSLMAAIVVYRNVKEEPLKMFGKEE